MSIAPSHYSGLQSAFFLIRRFMGQYKFRALLLVIISIAVGLLTAVQPLFLAPVIQGLEKSPADPAASLSELSLNNIGPTILYRLGLPPDGLLTLAFLSAAFYIGCSILVGLFSYAAYLLAMWLRTTIARDLGASLQAHLLELPLGFFARQRAGDLMSRFTNDVTGAAYFIDSISRGLIQSLVMTLVCFILLVRTAFWLAFAALVIGLLHLLITRALSRHVRDNIHHQNEAMGGFAAALQEAFLGIRTIKSFSAEKFWLGRYRDEAETVRHRTMRYVFFKHLEEPFRLITNALVISSMLVLCIWSYSRGELSLGGFALFLALTYRMVDPVQQFSMHLLALSGMMGCTRRIIEILDTKSTLVDGATEPAGFNHSLKIEKVNFGYDPVRPVLSSIDLEISRGEMIAIVGPSGSGKTTLADVILRLFDPQEGRILLDGRDIREFRQRDYRKLFGVVSQDGFLMNGNVRDNILFGRPLDEVRLRRALELAAADEFVKALPMGVETQLGERGVRLSGGQRQRLAIARAVYDQPPILIFDEATSALDSESERTVQLAIERVLENATGFLIAHRLSTVMRADRIVVLRDGIIDSIGRHDELIQRSELYRLLCRTQFSGSEADLKKDRIPENVVEMERAYESYAG